LLHSSIRKCHPHGIEEENHDVVIIMSSLRDWTTTISFKTHHLPIKNATFIASIPKKCRRHEIIIAMKSVKTIRIPKG
jgi:hypothetical protein